MGMDTEGLADFQGRIWDYFRCAVEPSPNHTCSLSTEYLAAQESPEQIQGQVWEVFHICVREEIPCTSFRPLGQRYWGATCVASTEHALEVPRITICIG